MTPRTFTAGETPAGATERTVLREVEQRVLWLATRMIDHANRRSPTEIKVGGHQASCASMVSLMTALWFGHLDRADKVAVKPHASPVYHAIKYLTGELDRSYLTRLREVGGLQAYPSRTKDPDVADFSTGSVGLGAVAPLFSAVARRYVEAHLGPLPQARFLATVGDAELDEGNVWEAIADPVSAGLGNVTLVVDVNRQSLDRVIPDIGAGRLERFFEDAGWHVVEAKYGERLQAAFDQVEDDQLRQHIDAMSNEAYQSLFALDPAGRRQKFLIGAPPAVQHWAAGVNDADLADIVTDLGGHDIDLLLDAFRSCDDEERRPSVVFAFTIKGWGLPIAGDPMNHAALLTSDQIEHLRRRVGLTEEDEWDRFDPDSAPGRLCAAVGHLLNNEAPPPRPRLPVPASSGPAVTNGRTSTQEAFGRVLARLADVEGVGERIVTAAPDVSISTSLGGWINKSGVFSPECRDDHGGADRLLRWAPSPDGRHLELGISEMNLFMLLGQLGLSHEHHGEMLVPVGTVYDPFVLRGLDALVYAAYNGARFVVAGTPSGITLAPEGGAHQSTITSSVGSELPGLQCAEPAFATEVDWLLCAGMGQLSQDDGESLYLRLSTRPLDQAPFGAALERFGEARLREDVLAGGYRLVEGAPGTDPGVTIVTTGVMVAEALDAAATLADEGVSATVVHLTSPDRTYRSWRRRYGVAVAAARAVRGPSHLHRLVPPEERHRPVVSVHDASSHSLAWVGSALGTRQVALGVDRFGESGTIADLYRLAGISAGDIVNASLIALCES